MSASLLGILGASLLGSAHCAAMCGGFVCVYASDARELRGHFLYNGGRLLSYLFLGIVAGAIGAGANHVGGIAGIGRAAAIVAGILMVTWGLTTLAGSSRLGLRISGLNAPQRIIGRVLARLKDQPSTTRAFAMGLLTTLIPCGWLYVFVAAAGSTGNPFRGALVMLVFWIGTVPAMMAVGLGAQKFFGPFRRHLPVAGAIAVVLIGLLTLTGRVGASVAVHGH
jgi:sulfite exporter TauE/SafE